MCLKVQVHRSWSVSSSEGQHYLIAKVITHPSGVRLRSMSTWWKAYLISFQTNLVPSRTCRQGHKINKTSCRYFCKELYRRHGLVIHPWDLIQVGARPKEIGNIPRNPLDVLPLDHVVRRPEQRRPSQIEGLIRGLLQCTIQLYTIIWEGLVCKHRTVEIYLYH